MLLLEKIVLVEFTLLYDELKSKLVAGPNKDVA